MGFECLSYNISFGSVGRVKFSVHPSHNAAYEVTYFAMLSAVLRHNEVFVIKDEFWLISRRCYTCHMPTKLFAE